jgi:hypothetical protein
MVITIAPIAVYGCDVEHIGAEAPAMGMAVPPDLVSDRGQFFQGRKALKPQLTDHG